jgi:hypothetical protein
MGSSNSVIGVLLMSPCTCYGNSQAPVILLSLKREKNAFSRSESKSLKWKKLMPGNFHHIPAAL